jgi:hypothetical protein
LADSTLELNEPTKKPLQSELKGAKFKFGLVPEKHVQFSYIFYISYIPT